MTKKILCLFLFSLFALPASAQNVQHGAQDAAAQKTEVREAVQKTAVEQENGESREAPKTEPEADRESGTEYYRVRLPEGWKIVTPPAKNENTGMTRGSYARAANDATIFLVTGPAGGASAKTIAESFAREFQVTQKPVEKQGQFTFSFRQQNTPCEAWVALQNDIFMCTILSGANRKAGMDFLRNNLSSRDYPQLLPAIRR